MKIYSILFLTTPRLTLMSENEDTDSYQEEEDEETTSNTYIQALIERIISRYEEGDELDVASLYKKLVRKLIFNYKESKLMEEDPLWEKIQLKAEDLIEEHKNIDISTKAAVQQAVKKHKYILLGEIKKVLKVNESDDNDSDDDTDATSSENESMDEDDKEGDNEGRLFNQLQTGGARYKTDFKRRF